MKKVLLGSLVFSGLYSVFFYPTFIGIGIPVLFLLLNIYLFIVRSEKSKYVPLATILSAISIFFAFGLGWQTNGVVQFFDMLLTLLLTLFAGYFYKKETEFSPGFFFFGMVPLSALVESLISVNNFFSDYKVKKSSRDHLDMYKGIFRGVIISLPVLFVLFLLLTGADPIFRELMGKISISLSEQAIVTLIIFAICLVWGITKIKDRVKIDNIITLITPSASKLVIESMIITFGISVLFAVFLMVQLKYLFMQVPEIELRNLGINVSTYSEYVRQGFFQLLFAAAIAGLIIVFILQYLHSLVGKHKLYLKIGLLLLSLETEFLLITAGKRLYLYGQAHGLTRSRIFGVVFLVWLSSVLILLFISVLRKIKASSFFVALSAITLGAFAVINIVPVDYLIAKYYPPTINHQIDYFYLSRLSPEVAPQWPGWIKNLEKSWKELSTTEHPTELELMKVSEIQSSLFMLNNHIYHLDRKYTANSKDYLPVYNETIYQSRYVESMKGKWQAYNIGEYQAYLFMRENKELFSHIKSILDEIDQRQKTWFSAKQPQ